MANSVDIPSKAQFFSRYFLHSDTPTTKNCSAIIITDHILRHARL